MGAQNTRIPAPARDWIANTHSPLGRITSSMSCFGIPRQNVALRFSRIGRGGSSGLRGPGQFLHVFDETVRAHVSPMLIYEFEAGGTARRLMNDGPAFGDLDEARPKRVLALVIYQNVVDAVFVFKWIGHIVLL
jgi:hypothetical protein